MSKNSIKKKLWDYWIKDDEDDDNNNNNNSNNNNKVFGTIVGIFITSINSKFKLIYESR